jgi:hypothetical protein
MRFQILQAKLTLCDLYLPRMEIHELNVMGDKYCKRVCAVQSEKKWHLSHRGTSDICSRATGDEHEWQQYGFSGLVFCSVAYVVHVTSL